jgi:uncharacterized protein (UPF0261 family)
MKKRILIVGTYDTKEDELRYLEHIIIEQGGATLTMDVSVLEGPIQPTDISKHDVANAAGSTIEKAIALDDENEAMQIMANGACQLITQAYNDGKIDGVVILGGSMGTDLALDVCLSLPVGFPKYIISTIAFSPLLPTDRIPADVQMILWAGGLYGLNSICKASLSQAAGAVLGAAKSLEKQTTNKPMVGMTSFGKTVLQYMVNLKPALEARGYEVAVFHPTGMGGRAFEDLAAQGRFVCVMDFATQEIGNHLFGSVVSAGPNRLTAAAIAGVPQIVAPGCHDLVDFPGWQGLDARWENHEVHAHNRLLSSIVLSDKERGDVAKAHTERLAYATGKSAFIMPLKGCHEWDREGAPLHNPSGLQAFAEALKFSMPDKTTLYEINSHINDAAFSNKVLAVFDEWFGV